MPISGSRWAAAALAAIGLLTPAAHAQPAAVGLISTVVGDGYPSDGRPGPTVALSRPTGVVARDGRVYVADTDRDQVVMLTLDGAVTLVAGTGTAGGGGDGGDATAAQLNHPAGLALDDTGNLYVADEGNNRIRRITQPGIITTVAGNGAAGFSGDGGPATAAMLHSPAGLTVDHAGTIYVADSDNQRIRRITPQGVISTYAGSGPGGQSTGDYTGDGGPATNARLNEPTGVAVAGDGTVYFADFGNHRIRYVYPNGVIWSHSPSQSSTVSIDGAGNMYLAESSNHVVVRFTPGGDDTIIAGNRSATTSGDGGPAAQAGVRYPVAAAMDRDGTLYITQDGRLRKVAPNGIISTAAGGGTAPVDSGITPVGIAVAPNGDVTFADSQHRVRRFATNGVLSTVAGTGRLGNSGDGGLATAARLYTPTDVALDTAGAVYIADTDNNEIRKVYPDGTIRRFAGTGDYGYSGDGGPATQATLAEPDAIALDHAGNLYIADASNHVIRKVDTDGVIATVAGGGSPSDGLGDGGPATSASLDTVRSIALDAAGVLYIADTGHFRLRKVTGGIITTIAGNGQSAYSGDSGPATQAGIDPIAIAPDNAGNLYIADYINHRIRKVRADGTVITVAGNGTAGYNGDNQLATAAELNYPRDVAVGSDGSLYVSDYGNMRIRKVTFGA